MLSRPTPDDLAKVAVERLLRRAFEDGAKWVAQIDDPARSPVSMDRGFAEFRETQHALIATLTDQRDASKQWRDSLVDLVDLCYVDGQTNAWRLCLGCETECHKDADRFLHGSDCAVKAAESLLEAWTRNRSTDQRDERIKALEQRCQKAEKAARVGIEGDNHHNAAVCPYCQPSLEKQAARNRELIERAERAEQALQRLTGEAFTSLSVEQAEAELAEALHRFQQGVFTQAHVREAIDPLILARLTGERLHMCPDAIAVSVSQRVAELPNRTSPDDWPEAMLVTSAELQFIVTDEINESLLAPQERKTPNTTLE